MNSKDRTVFVDMEFNKWNSIREVRAGGGEGGRAPHIWTCRGWCCAHPRSAEKGKPHAKVAKERRG